MLRSRWPESGKSLPNAIPENAGPAECVCDNTRLVRVSAGSETTGRTKK